MGAGLRRVTNYDGAISEINDRLQRLRHEPFDHAPGADTDALRDPPRGLLQQAAASRGTVDWSRLDEIRRQTLHPKSAECPARYVIWGLFLTAMYVLAHGCAAPTLEVERDTLARIEPLIVIEDSPARPRSLLLDEGAGGLDATQYGRTEWPSAYRDDFSGEFGAYREYFFDQQGAYGIGGYGGAGGFGGFTVRRFQSNRVGAFSR